MSEDEHPTEQGSGPSRREVLRTGAAASVAAAMAGVGATAAHAAENGTPTTTNAALTSTPGVRGDTDLALINGRIHTMDANDTVVSHVLIRNGRFIAAGNGPVRAQGRPFDVVNLRGRTVIPGIVDAHNHIVLVGNRPGWHVGAEDVFTIPDAVARYQERVADVPPGEFITTVGPISAMQFAERRLPLLAELDAVDRPVYIQAAQGGTRTNSQGKAWLEARGVVVAADGVIGGGATGSSRALQVMREQLLTPESRVRTAHDALQYFTTLGITTHRDSGAFHSELPSGGIANENTYTMHRPFLTLDREERMVARLRIDFLHQDPASDPTLPTLAPRLRNNFPFFGNDWLRTGGIGEFVGGGIEGLRAIARAGWRGEDHSLNLASAQSLIALREQVHAEIPVDQLRWVISHIPGFNADLASRFHAIGGGVLVGWGPTRTGTNVGPPYRMLYDHPIQVAYHSDGGDITVINPWLNLYTMITGRNLAGAHILGDQNLTRQQALKMATAATKWFVWEDDLGSIEVGNHADLAVLDRDFFTVPDEEIYQIRSLFTVVGGKVVHDPGRWVR